MKGKVLLDLREANYHVLFEDPTLLNEQHARWTITHLLVSHDWRREASMLELDGIQLRVFFRHSADRAVDFVRQRIALA